MKITVKTRSFANDFQAANLAMALENLHKKWILTVKEAKDILEATTDAQDDEPRSAG